MSTAIGDEEYFPSLLTGWPTSPKKSKENSSLGANQGNGSDTPWAVKRGPRLTYAESLSMEQRKNEPKLGDVDIEDSPFNIGGSSAFVRRRKPHNALAGDDHDDDAPPPPTSSLSDPTGFLSNQLPSNSSTAYTAAASTAGSSSSSFFQGDEWGYDKQYWVTVYGFPASSKAFVLQQFQGLGEVINYSSGSGNWLHIRYHTRLQAEKALSYDGQTLAGSIMIGVKKCLPSDIEGVQQEPTSKLYFSSQSRKNPGSKSLEVDPVTEEDIMLPPKRRQDICSRLLSFLFNCFCSLYCRMLVPPLSDSELSTLVLGVRTWFENEKCSLPSFTMLPSIVPRIQAKVLEQPFIAGNAKLVSILSHPAGPFTIHFWAPTFKWGISIANIADMKRSPETISVPQQIAVTATGLIWSRYSLVITPKNWNLFAVNMFMGATGMAQLYRKATYNPEAEAKKQE
ncbi:hypothetical protein Poli38472_001039 [Pythium oligandrum]|uniref:Mitochondrial pyruvate carrier n=1 Tax=Pythium oligandrum TaxID=41045 RepID=A0A8K1CTY0_PYTOL|nr:hypothetical protein Poli38472_001039 [Pythium oligandrum]|eukprot:TMW68883.1 hypothetical protein Poli38472_001039 [Pythium oligandrum]